MTRALNERGRREVRLELHAVLERIQRRADELSASAAALEIESNDLRRSAAALREAIEIIERAEQGGDG